MMPDGGVRRRPDPSSGMRLLVIMREGTAWKRPAIRPAVGSVAAGILLLSNPALAYVGPGAGITAIGTVLALVAALALALVGFVWYPIKRLRRRKAEHRTPIKSESRETP